MIAKLVVTLAVLLPSLGAGPPNPLPPPTGSRPVATFRTVVVDSTRPEPMTSDGEDHRMVVVRFWYPVSGDMDQPSEAAPYVFGLSGLKGQLPAERWKILDTAEPHSRLGDGFHELSPGEHPLVVLAPALGAMVAEYTSVAEDLASHGYVVAGMHPPHDGGPVAIPGTPPVPHSARWEEMSPGNVGIERHFAFSRERVEVLAKEASFLLDWLGGDGPATTELAAAAGRISTEGVAFVGHSLGGKAASLACHRDERFRACVNFDGWPLPGLVEVGGVGRPYMLVEEARRSPSDARLENIGATRQQYEISMAVLDARISLAFLRSDAPGYHVRLPGISHYSFSDRHLLLDPSARPEGVTTEPAETIATVRQLVRSFLHTGSTGESLLDEGRPGGSSDDSGPEVVSYPGGRTVPGRACTPTDPSAPRRLGAQQVATGQMVGFLSALAGSGEGRAVGVGLGIAGRPLWVQESDDARIDQALRALVSGDELSTDISGSRLYSEVVRDPSTTLVLASSGRDSSRIASARERMTDALNATATALSFCGATN